MNLKRSTEDTFDSHKVLVQVSSENWFREFLKVALQEFSHNEDISALFKLNIVALIKVVFDLLNLLDFVILLAENILKIGSSFNELNGSGYNLRKFVNISRFNKEIILVLNNHLNN